MRKTDLPVCYAPAKLVMRMEIEEALLAYLFTKTALTNLVAQRIHLDELPQSREFPAITIDNISDVKEHTLTGIMALESPTYQFTCFATTRSVAKAVAKQVKAALSDYQGTISGLVVQYVQLINELSRKESTPDGTIKTYTTLLEFEVNFERGA